MDSKQAGVWITALLVLLAAIFIMSGCVQKQSEVEAKAITACARMGGEWGPARGTTSSYTCIRKGY